MDKYLKYKWKYLKLKAGADSAGSDFEHEPDPDPLIEQNHHRFYADCREDVPNNYIIDVSDAFITNHETDQTRFIRSTTFNSGGHQDLVARFSCIKNVIGGFMRGYTAELTEWHVICNDFQNDIHLNELSQYRSLNLKYIMRMAIHSFYQLEPNSNKLQWKIIIPNIIIQGGRIIVKRRDEMRDLTQAQIHTMILLFEHTEYDARFNNGIWTIEPNTRIPPPVVQGHH